LCQQISQGIAQGLRLRAAQLGGPASAADEHSKGLTITIPGNPPALTLALDHIRSITSV
jgi:hypothetical protein